MYNLLLVLRSGVMFNTNLNRTGLSRRALIELQNCCDMEGVSQLNCLHSSVDMFIIYR